MDPPRGPCKTVPARECQYSRPRRLHGSGGACAVGRAARGGRIGAATCGAGRASPEAALRTGCRCRAGWQPRSLSPTAPYVPAHPPRTRPCTACVPSLAQDGAPLYPSKSCWIWAVSTRGAALPLAVAPPELKNASTAASRPQSCLLSTEMATRSLRGARRESARRVGLGSCAQGAESWRLPGSLPGSLGAREDAELLRPVLLLLLGAHAGRPAWCSVWPLVRADS